MGLTPEQSVRSSIEEVETIPPNQYLPIILKACSKSETDKTLSQETFDIHIMKSPRDIFIPGAFDYTNDDCSGDYRYLSIPLLYVDYDPLEINFEIRHITEQRNILQDRGFVDEFSSAKLNFEQEVPWLLLSLYDEDMDGGIYDISFREEMEGLFNQNTKIRLEIPPCGNN